MLRDLDSALTEIHMVILTDNATVAILHNSHFEMFSPFTKSWVRIFIIILVGVINCKRSGVYYSCSFLR